jgi:hypothetical protein
MTAFIRASMLSASDLVKSCHRFKSLCSCRAGANASHFIFESNEADVLREINAFVAGLK